MIQAKEVRRHKIAVRTRGPQPQGSSSQTFSFMRDCGRSGLAPQVLLPRKHAGALTGLVVRLLLFHYLLCCMLAHPFVACLVRDVAEKLLGGRHFPCDCPAPRTLERSSSMSALLSSAAWSFSACDSSGPCHVRTESAVAPVARAWARRTAR